MTKRLAFHRASVANKHQLVNAGNAKAVERRKLRAEYIKFLKASQEFYHDFIGALNTAYEIPEMCRLSKELGFNKGKITA